MKNLQLLLLVVIIAGCSSASRVSEATDEKVCRMHGDYWLQQNEAGLKLTSNEVESRKIDPETCIEIANNFVERKAPAYKKKYCEHLAVYQYKGAYEHFKKTLTKLSALDMADDECVVMAQFYMTRLERSQEKMARIATALQNAANNVKPFPLGSYFNPVHVKVQ